MTRLCLSGTGLELASTTLQFPRKPRLRSANADPYGVDRRLQYICSLEKLSGQIGEVKRATFRRRLMTSTVDCSIYCVSNPNCVGSNLN